MILDARALAPEQDPVAAGAVLVVGSGAAGIALSLALADRGRPVLLVESGGDHRDRAQVEVSSRLNTGLVQGLPYAGLTGGRSRALGGATGLWYGQCTRLHPEDVGERAWVPDSGWPLPFSELERWYPSAEDFFGLTGAGYGEERWAEHPSLPPVAWDGEHLLHDFTEYTPTPHLGERHRAELTRSPLITVLTHATVARVVLDGDRAGGVEVVAPDGRERALAAATVVLAAGAVENARILMLSDPAGIGLGGGARWTGRFLQDHPVVGTAEIEPLHGQWLQDRYQHLHRGRRRLYPKVRLSAQGQAEESLLAATAVIKHDQTDPRLDAARRVLGRTGPRPGGAELVRDAASAAGAVGPLARTAYRRWVKGLSAGPPASRVWLQVWLEQAPDPESRVLLADEVDELGLAKAAVDWRVGDAEVRTSRQLTRWVAADLARLGLAHVREREEMRDDDAWRAGVADAYHPAGTTRMSVAGGRGVVDADTMVHGVQGVYAAGSSTFPTAGYANPTLTIVALAHRLAHHLAGRQRA